MCRWFYGFSYRYSTRLANLFSTEYMLGHSLGYGCMYECAYDVCICERCVHSKVDLNGCSQTDRQTDR